MVRMNNYTLETPPEWLCNRDEYKPWDSTGRPKIVKCVDGWQAKYAKVVFDAPDEVPQEPKEQMFGKLYNCWLFHWENGGTARDGSKVVDSLENERGFQGGGNLGGNPLFDLVEAEALWQNQNKAWDYYRQNYAPTLNAVAQRVCSLSPATGFTSDDWMQQFYLYLRQSNSKQAPRLRLYAGQSGLKQWLATVLTTFIHDKLKRPSRLKIGIWKQGENMTETTDNSTRLASERRYENLYSKLILAFQNAYATLDEDEKTRIRLYINNVSNVDVARTYGENESKSTRKRQAILEKFRKAFFVEIQRDSELRDNFNDLLTDFHDEIRTILGVLFGKEAQENDENEEGVQQ